MIKKTISFLCAIAAALTFCCGAFTAHAQTEEEYTQMCEKMIEPTADSSVFTKRSGVKYGEIKRLTYYSNTAGRDTPVNVILPPEYDENKKYPVLYILHGFTDTQDWMLREDVALVNMLGNLISDGKAKQMIVVLPYIFCSREQEKVNGFDISASPAYDNFINDLKTDLFGFILNTFSVKRGRENTAITGFSMGGRESLFIGTQMSDVFGYVGAVCPAPGLTPGENLTMHPGQLKEEELTYDAEKGIPYLTLISQGADDNFVGASPKFYYDLLTKNSNKCLLHTVPNGAHNASSVKQHLYNYTKMIFNTDSEPLLSIASLSADSESITASVENKGAASRVCVIAAYFSEDNLLVDISLKNTSISAGTSEIKLDNTGKGKYIKAFLWSDLEGIIPISMCKETAQPSQTFLPNEFSAVPAEYFLKSDAGGRIAALNYTAKDYLTSSGSIDKRALVYLPADYSEDKKYNVLYLLHGGADSEVWCFTNAGSVSSFDSVGFDTYDFSSSKLKNMLDNMIKNGDMEPCIVCTPTYKTPYDTTQLQSTKIFYGELVGDLIPALESKYSTYFDGDVKKTRMHRALGGFSMGSSATWYTFLGALDSVGGFIPISGDCWAAAQGGGASKTVETVDLLEAAVKQFGMTADDFYIYAVCGNSSDIASPNMTPQIEEMKKRTDTFKFCDNFADGNFYFAVDKNHGHVIDTVYSAVYNAAPKLFTSSY